MLNVVGNDDDGDDGGMPTMTAGGAVTDDLAVTGQMMSKADWASADLTSILGGAFYVEIPSNASVYELQQEIKKKKSPNLNDVDTNRLNVWKLRNPRRAKEVRRKEYLANLKRLDEVPENRDEDDDETAWLLESTDEISLHISGLPPRDSRTRVLVQVPVPALGGGQERRAYEEYRDCFLQTSGGWFDDYILLRNNVDVDSPAPYAPEYLKTKLLKTKHLKKHHEDLQKKRAIHIDSKDRLTHALGDCFKELYDSNKTDESVSCELEMLHMLLVAQGQNDKLLGKGWKAFDAHAIFFTHFARYCRVSLPKLSPSFGFGSAEWPLRLVLYDKNCPVQYSPKNDFFATLQNIPRIMVEVQKSSFSRQDQECMLAQGASLVRLANKILAENGGQRNFILMAIYSNVGTTFDRYLLHQEAEKDQEYGEMVYCFKESFLNNRKDRARLTQQMYNLASMMREDADRFRKLRDTLDIISLSAKDLPIIT
ncbi:hypothetical protein FISHEDRAFT_73840 [Fistulina hepatica ATCC 64428]|uniref:Crinkler effector protein N-terminal domain-containing protein n=1 Tax=Fistulina hepatica ATCC 64428 TaxID=1128425 RepID=A0A0D7AEG5_9AGAR|nr:hypothetical protein FISHEDRAFT_73840 [Fistulina hepatica ATCC 64428]